MSQHNNQELSGLESSAEVVDVESPSKKNRASRRQAGKQAAEERIKAKRLEAAQAREKQQKERAEKLDARHLKDLEIRALLEANNVPLPARVVLQIDEPEEPLPENFQDCGNGTYLVRSKSEDHWQKVQLKRDQWSCTCGNWKGKRGLNCGHIKRAIDETQGGRPYSTSRRLTEIRIYYPQGQLAENTRREHASQARPTRCPEIFKELCEAIIEPPKDASLQRGPGGARPIPLRVRAYALLTKIALRLTYAELAKHLAADDTMRRLGWMKVKRLSVHSLHAICGDKRLQLEYEKMIRTTAVTVCDIERTAIIDGTGYANSIAGNYYEEKYGIRKRRKGRRFIKVHQAQGGVTNIVAHLDITLDHGVGSGDAPHYGRVTRGTKQVWNHLECMLGDAAYGTIGNYDRSTAMKIKLITREKTNEDRLNWGGQAAELAKLQSEDPDAFFELYRPRSRGELPQSRIKRHQSYIRLRRRADDLMPIFPEKPLDDEAMCDLPDDILDPMLDLATDAVGQAQRNETLAMYVAANVREIVMLEHLHDERVCFAARTRFTPIKTVREKDLRAS